MERIKRERDRWIDSVHVCKRKKKRKKKERKKNKKEGNKERERERERVCVCVRVREREREREKEKKKEKHITGLHCPNTPERNKVFVVKESHHALTIFLGYGKQIPQNILHLRRQEYIYRSGEYIYIYICRSGEID